MTRQGGTHTDKEIDIVRGMANHELPNIRAGMQAAAKYLKAGKPVPLLIGAQIAVALEAASKPGLTTQQACNAFGRAIGLLAGNRRRGLPSGIVAEHEKQPVRFQEVAQFVATKVQEGMKNAEAISAAARKFSIAERTVTSYVSKYKARTLIDPSEPDFAE